MRTFRNRLVGLAFLATFALSSMAHASMLARGGGAGHGGSIGGEGRAMSETSGGGPLGEQFQNQGTGNDYGFKNEGRWWGSGNVNSYPQNPNTDLDFSSYGSDIPQSSGSYYGVPGGNSSSVDTYIVPYGE